MDRIVVLFNCKYKQMVSSFLVAYRFQYSMFVDIHTGDVRVSLPRLKCNRLLAMLRRNSISYELI